ncbi:uncharacterized protein [Apostichopus japonicus]
MSDEKSGNPPHNPAYPPPQQGSYPMQPNQPGGGAPPPYYQPPAGQQYPPPGQQYPPPGQQYPPPGQQYPPVAGQQYPPQGGYVAAPQQPGQTVIVRQTQIQPNDYLGFAIFVTICCCLPFGIVGIIKATEVRSRFVSGDYQGAEDSSRSAKNWSCAGLVTGLILFGSFFFFYVILYVVILGAAAASSSSYY